MGQQNEYGSKYQKEEENDVELKGDVELDFNDESRLEEIEEFKENQQMT